MILIHEEETGPDSLNTKDVIHLFAMVMCNSTNGKIAILTVSSSEDDIKYQCEQALTFLGAGENIKLGIIKFGPESLSWVTLDKSVETTVSDNLVKEYKVESDPNSPGYKVPFGQTETT